MRALSWSECWRTPARKRASTVQQQAQACPMLLRDACRRSNRRGTQNPCRWSVRDSNPRPPACKAGAFPAELTPRITAENDTLAQLAEVVDALERIAATVSGRQPPNRRGSG
jgi:hypothetical protein